MKIDRFTLYLLVTILVFSIVGISQTVVQNPTVTQSIVQPAGTEFDVTGVQSLLWPNAFRIANEGGTWVYRDMTQTDAWYMTLHNTGSSTASIILFGNFTGGGSLLPFTTKSDLGNNTQPWGRIFVQSLFKSSGAFRIDHPLDPLHKYLQHSFVESPDMKNVYDGIAVLDKHGEVWVTLPEWFQALNSDFRYQLTSIGAASPGLYVAQEVSGNRFKIAGGKAGGKVSWQLTGIRQDDFAKDHRIKVEEIKPPEMQGKLIYDRTKDEGQSKTIARTPLPLSVDVADQRSMQQESK